MARTIHESVAGLELFVPDANDFFDIDETGMPNGDPCLIINPDSLTTPDYRAFAPVPTLVPDLMHDAAANPWSLSLWIQMGSGTGNALNCRLFGIQNASAVRANSATPIANANWPMSMRLNYHNNGVVGLNLLNGTGSGVNLTNITIPLAGTTGDSNWHFAVFRIPIPGATRSYYKDNDLDITGLGNAPTFSGGSAYNSNQRFYIGAYADSVASDPQASSSYNTGTQTLTRPLRLGKIAFHDHLLTLTEMQMMYGAMMGV